MPMRPYRLVFSTLDRDGNEVRLTESQWRHIIHEHSDMEPYINEIRGVVQNPAIITAEDDGVFHLLRLGAISSLPRLYLRVVVIYSAELTGRRLGSVRTAFSSERLPRGERIL